MADVTLTRDQQAVVDDRGGQLLVSAAAGSGKTKVLVDRLLSYVTDPARPCDVDEFLIITYTKAAAAELRAKITAALSQRLAARPGSAHLLRQMNRITCAHISTVHAFCADLLRTRAAEAGLDPEFRVAEEAEAALLRARAIKLTLGEAYASMTPDGDFASLADTLGAGRNDRALEQLVGEMFDQAQCHADPAAWLARCRAMANGSTQDVGQTVWGAWLMEAARRYARAALPAVDDACREITGEEKLEKGYGPTFFALRDQLARTKRAEQWEELSVIAAEELPSLRAVRGYDDKALLEQLKALRDRVRGPFSRVLAPFAAGPAEAADALSRTAPQLRALVSLTERFSERYAREKKSRRVVDFSDLEHETIRLLRSSDIAAEVAAQFREVMVDEYQDTNAVQDAIFTAVSGGGTRLFMVGDVKQSIYRFRLADPTIFLGKYRSFPNRDEASDGQPRRILLRQNFRSRPEILSAANHVFRTVMSEQVGDLDYTDEAALEPGARFASVDGPLVELHCIESGRDDDSPGKLEQEAEYAASRIAELLTLGAPVSDGADGLRPCRAEDIVILMRSPRSAGYAYQRALARRGIRAETDQGGDILETAEVQTLLSVLQLIDNPHQDVPLLAALGSPVFAFSTDLLAAIRAASRQGDLYAALCAYEGEDPAPQRFCAQLASLRAQADFLPLDALVDAVLRTFGFFEVYGAMDGGAARLANLQTFVEYCASYSAGSYRLLMDFLQHIAQMKAQERAITPGGSGAGGAVKIMSIHKSKGLEYPIVFLSDLSHKFNLTDLTRPVLLDPELGAGADAVDAELLVRYPTAAKQAIAAKKRAETISEELRVLYVAMTRPKDRLIMTYCAKNLRSELNKLAAAAQYPADPAQAAEARSMGTWVLMAALCRAEAEELFAEAGRPDCVGARDGHPWRIRYVQGDAQTAAFSAAAPRDAAAARQSVAWDEGVYGYRYAHLAASALPAKLTATQMKGRTIDAEAAEQAPQSGAPEFLPPLKRREAAARGSATHLAMQYLDDQRAFTLGVEAEIARECEQGFLTPEQAAMVRTDELERLVRSGLGARLRAATMAREMKFSILMDARACIDGAPEGERILVQGVADCILREEDGLTVVDYKTDRVRPGQEELHAERYVPQMRTYVQAVRELYGAAPRSCLLYFFATGKAVEMIDRLA